MTNYVPLFYMDVITYPCTNHDAGSANPQFVASWIDPQPHRNGRNGLVQDCRNSSALAMELLQSCTKPSITLSFHWHQWQRKHSWRSLAHAQHVIYLIWQEAHSAAEKAKSWVAHGPPMIDGWVVRLSSGWSVNNIPRPWNDQIN